jgi:DNA-binding MarR family transcriptional regulator
MNTSAARLRPLIDRLARLSLSEDWAGDLNPSQRAALRYLARANRFSRAPSHLADYLGATRGTVSQTLAALERKSLVTEVRSASDRRRISLDLTAQGRAALGGTQAIDHVLDRLEEREAAALEAGLEAVLTGLLQQRGSRPFGLCRGCRYHQATGDGLACGLLKVPLTPEEAGQICHEQVPRSLS